MTFARWVFRIAGVYGLLVLPPMYFMERWIGQMHPPELNHTEYYYGFVGVAIAWQFAFLIIGHDPVRYRPLMLPSVIEKFTYGIATVVLFAQGRLAPGVLAAGCIDSLLGVLFLASWWLCAPASTKP
jgi:hypothetical protein